MLKLEDIISSLKNVELYLRMVTGFAAPNDRMILSLLGKSIADLEALKQSNPENPNTNLVVAKLEEAIQQAKAQPFSTVVVVMVDSSTTRVIGSHAMAMSLGVLETTCFGIKNQYFKNAPNDAATIIAGKDVVN